MNTYTRTRRPPHVHRQGELALDTLSDLKTFFDTKGHRPSDDQWKALTSLVECMERITTGRTDRKVFLSSLDPGIGKTSCLRAFVRSVLRNPRFDATGILICINSYREMEAFIASLVDEFPGRIGTWIAEKKDLTSPETIRDEKLDGLLLHKVLPHKSIAQVLVTTHERITIEMRSKGSFELADGLYFRSVSSPHGQPRVLRVWDEAWSPSLPITINAWKAFKVLDYFADDYPGLASTLRTIFSRVQDASDGDSIVMPNYVEQYRFDRQSFLEVGPEGDRDLLEFLFTVSGKPVSIKQDGKRGGTVLTFKDVMPTNIAPLVVLDASGRVRVFYDDLKERGVVHVLKTAAKNYEPLKIHHWNKGGGKQAFRDPKQCALLVEGIAKAIATKPDEAWLVVHHKEGKGVPDLPTLIRRCVDELCVGDVRPVVRFVSWGMHRSSNSFVNISNVVLAGLLTLPPSAYEAGKRIGLGLRPKWGRVSGDELKEFQIGEYASDILQALCRSSVRRSDGEKCGGCNAYLICKGSDLVKVLSDVFPGIPEVAKWQPVVLKLSKLQRRVFEHVAAWASGARRGDRIRFRDVQKALGLTDPSHFARDRSSAALVSALIGIGVTESGGQRKTAWTLSDPSLAPDADASAFGFEEHDDE